MFWGRLTYEKGFDLIIKWIDKYKWSQIINNIYIDIYGEGQYASDLQNLIAINKINNVKYYWRQTSESIKQNIAKIHYALMPSRFIETFWLSALEACEAGKPLIGFAKWWLSQFVIPKLDISSYDSDYWEFWQFEKCMMEVINNFDINIYTSYSHMSSKIAKNFTKKKRLQKFEHIISSEKND